MNTLKQLNKQIETQKEVVNRDERNLEQSIYHEESENSVNHYKTKLNISKSILESLLIIQKNLS
jgi:hypothetical protein